MQSDSSPGRGSINSYSAYAVWGSLSLVCAKVLLILYWSIAQRCVDSAALLISFQGQILLYICFEITRHALFIMLARLFVPAVVG